MAGEDDDDVVELMMSSLGDGSSRGRLRMSMVFYKSLCMMMLI